MSASVFPLRVPAVRVTQPLGEFYVVSLTAEVLLRLTYSDPLKVVEESDEAAPYQLRGTQREESRTKLREITRFIETTEAAFPNSIILGANYHESGESEDEIDKRWDVEFEADGCLKLIIPTAKRLANIIDGQHRLHGFEKATPKQLLMELPCSVYLDLPNPFQAYLFATINFNQKKVDRSLAYSLFGFNIDQEAPASWSPDKTGVFMARKLNTDDLSPFKGRIVIAAQNDEVLLRTDAADDGWVVSMATVVDGLLRLFSKNPKRDRDEMHRSPPAERTRNVLVDDGSPLRNLYLSENDVVIYTIAANFFTAAKQLFWDRAGERSFIYKTVGNQALFDVLKTIAREADQAKKISVSYFVGRLAPAEHINFADDFFQASGKGRNRLRRSILLRMGLDTLQDVDPLEKQGYERVGAL